ncbi:MAG: hypothetical protein QCI82_12065, partial [Candidatus Thermoplasmatota archaeon]|nr:hypothetical protein [Candidatus Thermoplasmatota archaeon]
MGRIILVVFICIIMLSLPLVTIIDLNESNQFDLIYEDSNSFLKAYWSFDEQFGNTVYDLSENNNHGLFKGTLPDGNPWKFPQRTGNSLYGRGLKFEDYYSSGSTTTGMITRPSGGYRYVEVESSPSINYFTTLYLDTYIFPYSYLTCYDEISQYINDPQNQIIEDSSVSNVIISSLTSNITHISHINDGSYQLGFNYSNPGIVEFRFYQTRYWFFGEKPFIIQLLSDSYLEPFFWHRITITCQMVWNHYSFGGYMYRMYINGICEDEFYWAVEMGGISFDNNENIRIGADPSSYAWIKNTNNNPHTYSIISDHRKYSQYYGIIDYIYFSTHPKSVPNDYYGISEIIGKYDFDEGAGYLAHDQSNYDRTITLNNVEYAPEWGWDERWGHCLDFNKHFFEQDSFIIEDSIEFNQEDVGMGIGFKFKPDNDCPDFTFIIGKTTSVAQDSNICGFTWAFWYSPSNSQVYFEINYLQGFGQSNFAVFGSPYDDSEWIEVYGYTDFRNNVQLHLNGNYVDGTSNLGGSGPVISGIDTRIHVGSAQWLNTTSWWRWEPYRYFLMPFDDIEGYRGLFDDLVFSRNCRINQVSERGFFDLDTAV